MEPTGDDQALHDADLLRPQLGPTEIPVFSPHRNHAVILPISGKKLKFITAGIPFMVDAYACSTASSVLTVASCMLRSNLAL
jgi:hypothetical protein